MILSQRFTRDGMISIIRYNTGDKITVLKGTNGKQVVLSLETYDGISWKNGEKNLKFLK